MHVLGGLFIEIIERVTATYVSATPRNHVTWQEILPMSNFSSDYLHQSCQYIISHDRKIRVENYS